jgi:hypothetical protein
MTRTLFMVLLLSAQSASGSDEQSRFATFGGDCREAIKMYEFWTERNEDPTFTIWLAGYVTAYNAATPGTYNILGSNDLKSATLWLYNWCKANPQRSLAEAAEALTIDLYPARHKSAKEAGR